MVDQEATVSLTNKTCHSMAIHDAILQPEINLAVVEKVITANPDSLCAVNVVTGLTPLQAAAKRSHCRLIRLLVSRGAVLEDRGQNGETPFLIACQVHPSLSSSLTPSPSPPTLSPSLRPSLPPSPSPSHPPSPPIFRMVVYMQYMH